jgi:tetratricopeptide (TPR) repeat protein
MVVAKMRLRIAMLCFVASLRLGLTAFVLPLGSHQRATSGLRAAVCRQSPSTSVLNRVLRLRWRGAPSGLISGTMQVQVEQDFNQPSVNTLVVKPHRGAVSAAAPFPSTHANTERTQEPPLPQKILDSESEAPELRMRMSRAKELIASGKFEAAEELLADTCTEFPNSGKLWMKRFKLARRQRLYGKARKVLQMALKHNPLNAILWQAWADLERSLGRVNVARNLYKKGLEANPWLASLYNSWGSMERNLGRVDMARRLFKEGLKHDGNSVRLLLSWGVMEDVDGNAELARSLLRRGLLVEPGNSFLLHALGMLDFKAGNVAGAREAFGTAVGVDGNHTQTWLALARLEESQGNIAVARKHYVSGCKSHCGRGTVQLWQAWARMEEKEGNSRAALDVYRKAILLFAADSQLLVECAKVLTKMGNVQEAEKLLGRALKGDPHNPYIYQVSCCESCEREKARAGGGGATPRCLQ